MITTLRSNRLGLKYTLITLALLGGIGLLSRVHALDGVERHVNALMNRLTGWGLAGMFVIGLFSNITLVFIVPYTLPMFTLAIYADSPLYIVALGTVTGIGAGIGEAVSYAVAHTIVARVDDIQHSALFRWTKAAIDRHPVAIPFLVWLASATPVPDMMVIVPLALIDYPWRKMLLPMIAGKICQNVAMAIVYRYALDNASRLTSTDLNFDMTAGLVIVFAMLLLYQVEKVRAERRKAALAPVSVSTHKS